MDARKNATVGMYCARVKYNIIMMNSTMLFIFIFFSLSHVSYDTRPIRIIYSLVYCSII